jgi:hypothetical protein
MMRQRWRNREIDWEIEKQGDRERERWRNWEIEKERN